MLDAPVHTLTGVGEKFSEELEAINIYTIDDLLFYFPSRYDTYEIKPLRELIHDDQVTIAGKVIHAPSLQFYGKRKSRLTFMVEVEKVAIKAVMFNRSFAKKHINQGDTVTLSGKWDMNRLQITINYYRKGLPKSDEAIQSVYSLKGKITNKRLRKVIQTALQQYVDQVKEIIPTHYLQAYKLPNRKSALKSMHMPENKRMLKHARRRFTYEEFLIFQLKMQLLRKINREASTGNAHYYDEKRLNVFIQRLPFTLTNAQKNALEQILDDMISPLRMNRLLQGDVGSGKTAVAAICLYAAVTAKKQGALMVPTEILAEQHFHSLTETFGESTNIVLLTGSIKGKKRKEIVTAIKNHEIDIVIGTHALIQDDVIFADLGFVIVDEQHRFGVEQRRVLRNKGLYPDVLFMTATPIPRTLAITAFGDMDVSVIDEMPSGRKKIETYWTKENTLERVLEFIKRQILQGEQAYVVCPLIEESDKMDIQNAVELYEKLQAYYSSTIKIGLMHGRLPTAEKERIMEQFMHNEVHILVSTTVIEVGVNVPNATIMVVYDAERFGLSQLHQLRGRVGRGNKQSYCILIADPKGEIGKERMKIMTETANGFELAEQDLQLRGPGDFFGKKQSGLPEFKVADMIHDYRALEVARKDAEEIISNNLLEANEEFIPLLNLLRNDPAIFEKLD
ncbi:ATP-dependent DNA helicase RecG [Virgibacillus sp. W0181]|uniref:ATP-dependent DNA helicase RecG n=1 Tax=Virgibacillus sp. W0181 TaxID=3391581 RepID=UPI003F466B94